MKNLYSDLIKLLEREKQACLIGEHKAVKQQDYFDAIAQREHRGTIVWLLEELKNYRKKGEWL